MSTRSTHIAPDADASIRETDNDAAVARLSAAQKGYLHDPYIRHLVPRAHLQQPRPPLINVGTYVRGAAIDALVEQWLQIADKKTKKCQIVSLGAGSDTRFWRIANGTHKDTLATYVEVDFPEVTTRKAMSIRKSKELGAILGGDIQVAQGGTALHAGKYHLLPGDLRMGPTALSTLLTGILDSSLPTLLLFECVLVYMVPSASDAVLRWFVDYFSDAKTPLGAVVYEMFNLEDAFGKVMVSNLKSRNVSIPGAEPYRNLEALSQRFLSTGFNTAHSETLREIRRTWIAPDELERLSMLEMLDEIEELELVLEHYAVSWGLAASGADASWGGWGLAYLNPQNEQVFYGISTEAPAIDKVCLVKGSTPVKFSTDSSTLSVSRTFLGHSPDTFKTAQYSWSRCTHQGWSSAVTFGSIDDDSAPISSSPVAAPPIKSEGVKSFGTVPASTGHVNGKSSISMRPSLAPSTSSSSSTPSQSVPPTPSQISKVDIKKLFQMPSSSPSSSSTPDTSSPSLRSSTLPPQSSSQLPQGQAPPPSQPSQLGSHSYTPFVPGGRQQQNSGPGGAAPRSPVYSRQIPNGSGPRPNGGPSQMPSGLSSPRLGSHPHTGPPSGMPPPPNMQPQMQPQMPPQMPVPGWPGYYYPGMPDQHYMAAYPPQWYPQIPPHMQPQPQHPHSHHPPPGAPPHNGMAMSPRSQPPPLQPGTPTQSHAVPSIHAPHPPPPHSHSASNSISINSPPPTPSTATGGRLNVNSSTFVPGTRSKVTLKNPDGLEVDLTSITKTPISASTSTSSSPGPRSSTFRQGSPSISGSTRPRPTSVRMETEEQRRKRLAEEEEKENAKARAKAEAEEKVKREREEKERKEREDAEKKRKEEEEKEAERVRKEEEEKERIQKEEEAEKERIRKEEEEKERIRKEEEERKLKEEEAEKARLREEEEKERLRKEAELAEQERLRAEEAKAAADAAAAAAAKIVETTPEVVKEEGEVLTEEPAPIVEQPKEKSRESLRINTATSSLLKKRPGDLDLSTAKLGNVVAPLPSALSTARIIEDINAVAYPVGINSPATDLNRDAKDGKFRYDRGFLLQFMEICKEKPDNLPPLDAIGLEPNGDPPSHAMSRGGSGRHRNGSGAIPPSRQASVGLGFSSGFGKPGGATPFSMGNFGASKLSSDERFNLANASRSVSVSGGQMPFGRPSPMQRTASQGGVGGTPMSSNRTRSKRGEKRGDGNKATGQQHGFSHGQSSMGQTVSMEHVAPLQATANRWDRKAVGNVDPDSPEVVDRKVKALLNKLTMEKFDSISDQIITWANKSEKEKDGRTLIQVIKLVFEKATDEATWSEMYARLCRKMMERISLQVQDDGIKNAEGKPITGGQLFRKYLLNRCQEDFERGWITKEATAAAAACKALEDQAAQEKNKTEGDDEVVLYSDEYYAAQKAKRQGLGLIKFIGELFKLQMLTERIMHECVKKLLGNVENPEEEEIESLCKLLSTVGAILDTQKARAHMDVYFSRMKELTKSPNVSSRMQFMLQDVLELRERKWVSRNAIAAPTTIAQIHEAAAKEKAAAEKETYQRQISMSRGGSRRGGDRGDYPQVGPDGWAVAGGNGPPRPPSKAGDLSNFGKINKTTAMTFGPSSVFAGKKENKRDSLSRTNSSSNMFSMLSQGAEPAVDVKAPEPQRKRIVLQPRSKPTGDEASAAKSESDNDDEEAAPEMTEEQVNKKIAEDLKEFFAVRNLDEAEVYFTSLPAIHHFRLVDKFTSRAVEAKEADGQLLADFFARAVEKSLCSSAAFEEGLTPIAEIIDDIAIDAPKAMSIYVKVVKSAQLTEEQRTRLSSKSLDGDQLLALLS